MKKLIIITGVILAAYLTLTAVITPREELPSAAAIQSGETEAESGFRIGVSQGRVAVFRDGELFLRTETLLSSLPKSDRARLEKGVHVDSLKELKELLEDYCS